MNKILIATHGELSKSFIETFNLIAGPAPEVHYFCMTKSKSSEKAQEEIREILSTKKRGENCIVLTDLFGGSISNICINLLSEGMDFELITGINLPMVLTILLSEEANIETVVEKGMDEAKRGVIHVNQLLKENKGGLENDIIIED